VSLFTGSRSDGRTLSPFPSFPLGESALRLASILQLSGSFWKRRAVFSSEGLGRSLEGLIPPEEGRVRSAEALNPSAEGLSRSLGWLVASQGGNGSLRGGIGSLSGGTDSLRLANETICLGFRALSGLNK
jgi:hypothetical protein